MNAIVFCIISMQKKKVECNYITDIALAGKYIHKHRKNPEIAYFEFCELSMYTPALLIYCNKQTTSSPLKTHNYSKKHK